MGLDFSKAKPQTETQTAIQTAPQTEVQVGTPENPVVESYDIVADRQQMNAALVDSKEVDDLCSKIQIDNMETIVTFGAEAADEISKASDVVLNSMNMKQLDETSIMLTQLTKIMSQFDIDEIKEEPNFFTKLFNNAKKQLDKLLAKYNTMGKEVDKIYVELKKYEDEIKHSNRNLEQMFEANVEYYHKLVKYILAGEQGCKEIEAYIEQRRADLERTGDNSIQFEIQSCEQALMMLEQRTQDLRTAESVAMQSIPMIKTIEFSNMNLVRKINSAFIVTLPVFKQALASGSSIKIETLETTWKTIMNGIEETKKIQEQAHSQRVSDQAKLQTIKDEFNRTYNMPKAK